LATFLRTLGSKIDDQPNESNGIDKNSDGSLRDVGTTTNESNNNCNTNGEHRFDPSIRPSAVTLNGDFVAASTLSSIDGGRGHVASVRSCGVTHVCLGNHEADIPLSVLKMRLEELTARSEGGNGRGVVVLNSNVNGLVDCSKRFDVISSNCGRIRLGLIGLLSDERGMFPAGTFRGLQIFDVRETMRMMDENIVAGGHADLLVPLTHQSINADIDLARSMLEVRSRRVAEDDDDERDAKGAGGGVILGGHEHIKIHERVAPDDDTFDGDDGGGDNRGVVEIIKSGQNSERAAVVDLRFDPTTRELVDANVHFEELDERHPLCPVADSVVKSHLAVLERMRNYVVFNAQTMLADYFRDPSSDGLHLPLSSEFTRYEQTTVGALFCTAVKIELGADVCVINGAPIKASKTYVDGIMSYDDLRNELPFPLKMVVVEITRGRLREAIEYSRTNLEEGKPSSVDENSKVERRGYLQTDFDYWKTGEDCNEDDNEILTVALPRNLLNGFCKIKPLMDFRSELESKHSLPDEDSYAKAIDLIVRYCLDDRWATIAQRLTFADLDMNKDGKLSRDEIRDAIRLVLREEASDALLDGMIDAIDNDQNGFIDENEFNLLLAKIRSQTWNL
jgi:2',3'-cyclic-nucleotide 2'-phosphodiesterase (5'-nucleotidase family)